MTLNDILLIYILVFLVSGTVVAFTIIRDLTTGRYKRLRHMQEEFSQFEKDVIARRRKLLGENTDEPK